MKILIVSLVLVMLLLAFSVGSWYEHDKTKPSNNEYQLVIYQTKFVLKDGERIVAEIPCTSDKVLDSLILKDNQ